MLDLNRNNSSTLEYIFPLFNFILALMLVVALRGNMIESEEIISDKQARETELLMGIVSVPLLVFISIVLMHSHWTITFDVCIVYAVFINRIVLGLLPRTRGVVLEEGGQLNNQS